MRSLVGAPATHLPVLATLSGSFSKLVDFSLNDFILIEGAPKILLVSYVIMLGSPALLSSPINASLGEVVVVVAV